MDYDAIVIGGGPGGSTSSRRMALAGLKVLVLEKDTHPRFHIGESFLPRNMALIKELGLEERLSKVPQVAKFGAEFAFGHELKTMHFRFDSGLPVGETYAFNIERAAFDNMLLDAAKDAGVDVREKVTVKEVPILKDGEVLVKTSAGDFTAKYLLDASGQGAFLGRQLGTRKVISHHRKVAYFGHFTGVHREPMPVGGYPTIVMYDEGWFWMIPIDEQRTSIGMVMDTDAAKKVPVPADQVLSWALPRVPFLAARCVNATYPATNHVIADFSFRCTPFAGPGYFLVGDAATFIDPIFSTGVCLAMMGGVQAADRVVGILRGTLNADQARRTYGSYVHNSSKHFFKMIELYHQHAFRELFMNGEGPLEVHRAVISLLAGHVFPPHPPMKIRWRMWLFRLCVQLQKHIALCPRHTRFSIFDAKDAVQQVEAKPLREPAREVL